MDKFLTVRKYDKSKFFLLPSYGNEWEIKIISKYLKEFFELEYDSDQYAWLGSRTFSEIIDYYNKYFKVEPKLTLSDRRLCWPGIICSGCWTHTPWVLYVCTYTNRCWKCDL